MAFLAERCGARISTHRFRRSSVITVVFAILPVLAQAPPETPRAVSEEEVKAAFLYNFVKFTEWPNGALAAPKAALTIGVHGDDAFAEVLERTIAGKTVYGRPLVVRRWAADRPPESCHVLFVGAADRGRTIEVLRAVRSRAVLTIGESDGFAHIGGVINFVVEDKRVRFEINPATADQQRLRLSSKLLALARIVKDRRP